VVLLRLGRFAVGVLNGDKLVASKTEGRYVKNRHKAGGSSQRRFERSRERLVRELYDKTCETVESIFSPHVDDLTKVFFGGEKHTLNAFQKRCGYLSNLKDKISSRRLNVGEPNQKALEAITEEVYSSRIMTFKLVI
jgi:peptide subunit release factor 1 (eRF1)